MTRGPSLAANLLRSSLGGAHHLPQAALPRELTHMAPGLEPERHARSRRGHAHPAPSGTAPRTGARPFQTVLPASSVDTRKTWGLGPAHQAPFGKHVAAPCPARSQTITEVKVSRG